MSGDIELNSRPNNNSNKFRVLYLNIRGFYNDISELQIVSRKNDIFFCSETLVSSRRHVSEVLLAGFNKHTLLLRKSRPCIRRLAAYIRSEYSATIRKDNVCNCHEIQLIRVL